MENEIFIVGIGASAGGLNALYSLFSSITENPGLSYVIVQHMKRDIHSHLPAILARNTALPVVAIEDGMEVVQNKVYVMPAGKKVYLKNGHLRLVDRPSDEKINHAIDFFFFSLANEMKDKAIAVILSGTGTDGVKGVKAVEDNGGIAIVQDPSTADFDGLPKNTIQLDHPDFVLPPEKIFDAIRSYANLNLSERSG